MKTRSKTKRYSINYKNIYNKVLMLRLKKGYYNKLEQEQEKE
jgi:hypothetical protein